MLRNGDVLAFSGGKMSLAGRIEVGRRFVDGKGIGDVESLVLKDRVHLSQVGLVMVVLAFSSTTGELLYGPDIVTRGVVTENGSEALVEGARDEVLRAIEEFGADARTDTAEMQTAIRRVVRRFFNKRIDRKPMIVPVLLEL
jgi:ribonuclease J